jgi:hypothetical protein
VAGPHSRGPVPLRGYLPGGRHRGRPGSPRGRGGQGGRGAGRSGPATTGMNDTGRASPSAKSSQR